MAFTDFLEAVCHIATIKRLPTDDQIFGKSIEDSNQTAFPNAVSPGVAPPPPRSHAVPAPIPMCVEQSTATKMLASSWSCCARSRLPTTKTSWQRRCVNGTSHYRNPSSGWWTTLAASWQDRLPVSGVKEKQAQAGEALIERKHREPSTLHGS